MVTMQAISHIEEPGRVYYATEARNATLRELLRMSPPTMGGKLGAILLKILRVPGSPQVGMALHDVARCSPADVLELRAMFDDTITRLSQLGFSPTIAQRLPILGDGRCSSLAFVGNDPTVYAIIVYASSQEYDESGLSFISRNATTIWTTSNMAQTLDNPQAFNTHYRPGMSPEHLYSTHYKRLKEVPTNTLRIFDDEEKLWSTLREIEALVTEFNVKRGVFRPMTISEIEAVLRSTTA